MIFQSVKFDRFHFYNRRWKSTITLFFLLESSFSPSCFNSNSTWVQLALEWGFAQNTAARQSSTKGQFTLYGGIVLIDVRLGDMPVGDHIVGRWGHQAIIVYMGSYSVVNLMIHRLDLFTYSSDGSSTINISKRISRKARTTSVIVQVESSTRRKSSWKPCLPRPSFIFGVLWSSRMYYLGLVFGILLLVCAGIELVRISNHLMMHVDANWSYFQY